MSQPHPPPSLPAPRQARSRAARERLLRAGEALLAEHAFEQTGVAALAKRARSSVGTFYRVIGDKDALLVAIHDDFVAHSHALIDARLAPSQFEGEALPSVLRAFVSLLVDVYVDREGLLRALIVRSSSDEAFRARVHALNAHVAEALWSAVGPRLADVQHPAPREALAFGAKVVLGTLNHQALVGGEELRAPARLVDQLTLVFCSYLGLERPKGPS